MVSSVLANRVRAATQTSKSSVQIKKKMRTRESEGCLEAVRGLLEAGCLILVVN